MHDILNEAYAMLPEVNIPKNPVRVLWRLWEKHGGKWAICRCTIGHDIVNCYIHVTQEINISRMLCTVDEL